MRLTVMRYLTILTGKKLCYVQFSTRMTAWLLRTFFICSHNQLSYVPSIITLSGVQVFKKVIHQIDGNNEWLLLSATFTKKFELVFAFTLETAFS